MPTFGASGSIAPAATKTPLVLTGSSTLRSRLVAFRIGTTGAPSSDASVQVFVRQSTAAGTSTAVTPRPKNGVSVAGGVAGSNASAEPTYTTGEPMLDICFNPRSFGQWMGYNPDAELCFLAVTANGLGFQIQAPGGALTTVDVNSDFVE